MNGEHGINSSDNEMEWEPTFKWSEIVNSFDNIEHLRDFTDTSRCTGRRNLGDKIVVKRLIELLKENVRNFVQSFYKKLVIENFDPFLSKPPTFGSSLNDGKLVCYKLYNVLFSEIIVATQDPLDIKNYYGDPLFNLAGFSISTLGKHLEYELDTYTLFDLLKIHCVQACIEVFDGLLAQVKNHGHQGVPLNGLTKHINLMKSADLLLGMHSLDHFCKCFEQSHFDTNWVGDMDIVNQYGKNQTFEDWLECDGAPTVDRPETFTGKYMVWHYPETYDNNRRARPNISHWGLLWSELLQDLVTVSHDDEWTL